MTDPTLASLDLTDETRIANEGYPWKAWDRLRVEAPILWYEPKQDIAPFWSISRHADILKISKRPDVFVSSKRLRLMPRPMDDMMRKVRDAREAEWGPNGLLMSFNDMDAPHHLKYRNLTSKRSTPRAMAAFESTLGQLASQHVGHFTRQLALLQANRDESVFERAYEFDITSNPNPHLAFGGYGAHFCIGAHLARAQLRAVFSELLELLPKLEVAGALVRMPNLHVGGYAALPVRQKAA